MLKKLIAHEWHDCWKLMALINGIVILLALIGVLIFNTNMYQAFESDNANLAAVGVILYGILFFISIGALGFVVCLFFYIRFYRNLYTDQGYLMQTLPVTPSMLILSKTIVAVIWQLISSLVVFSSIMVLAVGFVGASDNEKFFDALASLIKQIEWPEGSGILIAAFLFVVIASGIFNIFHGYTAVSVGQLFRKQKVIGAIASYVGIYMVIQTISSFAAVFMPAIMSDFDFDGGLGEFGVFMLIIGAALTLIDVALFFLNEHIMKNKLNLD